MATPPLVDEAGELLAAAAAQRPAAYGVASPLDNSASSRRRRITSTVSPAHSGFFSRRASSPMTPRRKVSTQTTKMTPCTTITQPPSWAR